MISTRTELGSVARVFNGKTPSKKEQRRRGFPVLKIKDVDEFGEFRGTFESFVETNLADAFPEKIVRENDILLLNAAHNAEYVASKLFFAIGSAVGALATGEWMIVRANPDELDPKFASFWLETPSTKTRIGNIVRGIHLYPSDMAELAMQLPPLPEQQRVARQLEIADRLCRMRRYALELSDTFLPAAFLELFGDRFKKGLSSPFGELVKITGGGTPSRDRPEFFQGRIPWLTAKDMRGDYIWDTEEHITEDGIENSATSLVPANSILVVVKSKVLMHRLPVAIAKVPMCHGQDIKSVQCLEGLHHEFARFVLKHHERRLLNIARGANTEGLTLPMLEELPVPKVGFSEQMRFAALVARHEQLRVTHVEALRQAEHLFQTLLHRAFNPR
jgi:type I restriction enzyme S subunit